MGKNKCAYCQEGYCTYGDSAEEQLDSETQWECDGTEDDMYECGIETVD